MTSSLTEQIEQAMAELQEQQTRMAETARELQSATATVTSKDRMVTAKVGAQGQVVSLTFNSTAYRSMAPAQLGALLTDLLNEARAEIGDRVMSSMSSFRGIGEALRASMTDGTELDELLAPLRSMRPGFDEEQARRNRQRQEEFRG